MEDSNAHKDHPLPAVPESDGPADAADSPVLETAGPSITKVEAGSRSWEEELMGGFKALQEEVRTGFAGILKEFREKLAFDGFKEEQIDRLHAELQTYKKDVIARSTQPLLQGIIRLHDDIGKVATALRDKPAEELTPKRFFRAIEGFVDDIELLLSQHGVETFRVPGEDFNPNRQTAVRTIPHAEHSLTGRIAHRLRPGFTQGEALLQRERVIVYSLSAKSAPQVGPAPPESTQETEEEIKET